MKIRKLLLLVLTFCIASSAQASIEHKKAELKTLLNHYIQAHKNDEHISAGVITVSTAPDQIYSVAAGNTQFNGKGATVTPENLFQIGSITKSFTSVIILKLAAENKLSLDDKVVDYFPQYSEWKNVTIRELLNMTSGIANYSGIPQWSLHAGENIQTYFKPERLVQIAADKPLHHGYEYTNTGYILAGMIAAKVTHEPYTQLMNKLLPNVGLNNSFYVEGIYPKNITQRMVSGYYYNITVPNLNRLILSKSDPDCSQGSATTDIKCSNMSWAGAAGGIVADTTDVTKWVRLLFTVNDRNQKSGLLAPSQLRDLKSIVSLKTGKPIAKTSSSDPSGFGLGVAQGFKKDTYWFYEGETLGYRVLYIYVPDAVHSDNGKGLIITIALNSQPVPCMDHIGDLMMKSRKIMTQP